MKAVDLFAGWGGFTAGATQAGVTVVWAANHWPLAVQTHSANHPSTIHVCQDLRQADWTQLPAYELLLASPACQGHSTASQAKRRLYHDALRATAWAVVDCAEVTRPLALVVENVPAFLRWQLFPLWKQALELLGYCIRVQVLRASHFGVPQRRDRLFVVGMRERMPPEIRPLSTTEPAFGPCIEWDAPGWRPIVACHGADARRRLEVARRNHGPRCLSQHVTGHPGVPLDEPIRTLTTKDQWVVLDHDQYRPINVREVARGMGFPDDFQVPEEASRLDQLKGFGNAVPPPLAKGVVAQVRAALEGEVAERRAA